MFRFNFHGGFLDGQSMVSGRDQDGLALPGEHYVFLTDRGRVGARFRESSPGHEFDQLHSQVYEVTRRDERPNEIVVRVDFVGEESAGATVGGATDDPYVDLIVELRFPAGRPHAGDVATRDAILAELLQHCSSPKHGGCPSPLYGVGDGPGALCIITRWSDEAAGRQRIADAIGRLLPGIEFEITATPGPT